jgi:hypothetical protein
MYTFGLLTRVYDVFPVNLVYLVSEQRLKSFRYTYFSQMNGCRLLHGIVT